MGYTATSSQEPSSKRQMTPKREKGRGGQREGRTWQILGGRTEKEVLKGHHEGRKEPAGGGAKTQQDRGIRRREDTEYGDSKFISKVGKNEGKKDNKRKIKSKNTERRQVLCWHEE